MNKEIKKLMLYLMATIQDIDDVSLQISSKDCKILYDYITNLQEENVRLREVVENLTTMTVCGDRKQIKNTAQFKLDQCQSRIDKAVSILKDLKYIDKYKFTWDREFNKALNILQGEEK